MAFPPGSLGYFLLLIHEAAVWKKVITSKAQLLSASITLVAFGAFIIKANLMVLCFSWLHFTGPAFFTDSGFVATLS